MFLFLMKGNTSSSGTAVTERGSEVFSDSDADGTSVHEEQPPAKLAKREGLTFRQVTTINAIN